MKHSSTNLGSFMHRIISHLIISNDAYFGRLHVYKNKEIVSYAWATVFQVSQRYVEWDKKFMT